MERLKAAHHGNVGAMLDLGAKYLGGEFGAVDVQKGVYWTRLAAGFNNPVAQSNLSLCYGRGVGVTRDVVEALKWATLAARQGDDKGQGLLIQAKAIMESKVGDQVRIRVGEWRSISPPRGLLHMFGVQAK
jgi:TPR repeat protein